MKTSVNSIVIMLFWAAGAGLTGCAGARENLPSLIKDLKRGNPAARVEAAQKIGLINPLPDQALTALVNALRDDYNSVYATAAISLKAGGSRGAAAIAQLLKSEEGWLRCRAVETLGVLGKDSMNYVEDLARSLEDHDPCVYTKAIDSLKKVGEPSIPVLLSALKNNNPNIRKGAAEALDGMGPEAQKKAVAPLLEMFKSRDEFARGAAAMSLSEMGASAVPAMLEVVLKEKDPNLRLLALNALKEAGVLNPEVMSVLFQALRDPVRTVRLKAALVIGKLGEGRGDVAVSLIPFLDGREVELKQGVADALGHMGASAAEAVPSLIGLLKDASPEVRDQAAESLMSIGTLEAVAAAEKFNRESLGR